MYAERMGLLDTFYYMLMGLATAGIVHIPLYERMIMAKAMGQYEKVLDVLKEANGADVTLDTFKQKCEVAV